jgi:hypothetical protein
MHPLNDRAPWRADFVSTLHLLGQAALRQPLGIADPVLCGAAAVELYTGGLWPAAALDVFAEDSRALTAALFAVGFRWTQRPRISAPGLWHPDLRIGIDVIEDPVPRGMDDRSNTLTIAIDLGLTGPADRELVLLKAVGIEDLIVEEAVSWLMQGPASGEAAARAGVLVGLARGGVSGRLRAGYLQRRLTWATNGDVAFDASLPERRWDDDAAPRLITLSQMRTLISAWRVRCGYSFGQPRWQLARSPHEAGPPDTRHSNKSGRAGDFMPTNVIILDGVRGVLPE